MAAGSRCSSESLSAGWTMPVASTWVMSLACWIAWSSASRLTTKNVPAPTRQAASRPPAANRATSLREQRAQQPRAGAGDAGRGPRAAGLPARPSSSTVMVTAA